MRIQSTTTTPTVQTTETTENYKISSYDHLKSYAHLFTFVAIFFLLVGATNAFGTLTIRRIKAGDKLGAAKTAVGTVISAAGAVLSFPYFLNAFIHCNKTEVAYHRERGTLKELNLF